MNTDTLGYNKFLDRNIVNSKEPLAFPQLSATTSGLSLSSGSDMIVATQESSGSRSAGYLVELDANGEISGSMMPIQSTMSGINQDATVAVGDFVAYQPTQSGFQRAKGDLAIGNQHLRDLTLRTVGVSLTAASAGGAIDVNCGPVLTYSTTGSSGAHVVASTSIAGRVTSGWSANFGQAGGFYTVPMALTLGGGKMLSLHHRKGFYWYELGTPTEPAIGATATTRMIFNNAQPPAPKYYWATSYMRVKDSAGGNMAQGIVKWFRDGTLNSRPTYSIYVQVDSAGVMSMGASAAPTKMLIVPSAGANRSSYSLQEASVGQPDSSVLLTNTVVSGVGSNQTLTRTFQHVIG